MTEPAQHGREGAQRWVDYLDWLRATIRDAVLALPEERRRASMLPSGWTPIELLSHVLHMEQRWFVWGFLAEPVAAPWGDWAGGDPDGADAHWRVPADVAAEDLARALDAIGARTRSVLASYALDERAALGGRFATDPPTLEWICFHVLAEYARHAGHLDIVVELGGDVL